MAELTAKERKHLPKFKLVEGVREIGVLWLALAPLDFVISDKLTLWGLAFWLGFGSILLVATSFIERRIHDAD